MVLMTTRQKYDVVPMSYDGLTMALRRPRCTRDPRGRVVKVADFSALNHSIISSLWVRASLGARVTFGTSQVLLAGVSGGFSPGTPVFAPPTD